MDMESLQILDAESIPLPQDTARNVPAILKLAPHLKEQSSTLMKPAKIKQDRHYDKEGKRWVRRRENSRFVANPHIVKPTTKDFGVSFSAPRATFPKPLPPFLSRHLSAPSALAPSRDPASANAGRYSLSLKGIRRDIRRSGPRSEQIVLDIEQELTQWLHMGGILLFPDSYYALSSSGIPGKALGSSNCIFEVRRTPTELVWRIDEDFPRFLLHCVARFHGVVSFSKTATEGDIRLTHLLRPNVTRPDFMAPSVLDTPPTSDTDILSVIVDTEESDAASEQGNGFGSQYDDLARSPGPHSPSDSLVDQHDYQVPSLNTRGYNSHYETDSSGGEREDDEVLSLSVDSLALAPENRDWEQTTRRLGPRGVSSPSHSPSRPRRRTPRRVPPVPFAADGSQLRFWQYVFA